MTTDTMAGGDGWLLAVSIGPVQEFIRSARRTRDLWFGSYVLSEISKAVARKLYGTPRAELIFPSVRKPEEIAPGSELNVANVLLAKLASDTDPESISAELQKEAGKMWRDFASDAVATPEMRDHWLVKSRWEKQVGGVVELYAAWRPLEEGAYQQTRDELMRLLGARKACRDFDAWQGVAGVPKSSLDGARETVLTRLNDVNANERKERLKLNGGEQLDTIGLTKRLGGTKQQYPSVSRIAADPWLRGLRQEDRQKLGAVCERLRRTGLVHLNPDKFPQYRDFPWESSGVYLNRCDEAVEAAPESERAELLKPLRAELRRLYDEYREPEPYLAILIADGDRMGKTISSITSKEEHQNFSRALARFATAARKCVEEKRGALVYAGGDDVLAFVPVDRAVECGRSLRDEFMAAMKDWSGPTLSMGIAIGHMMEPLEDLLEYARGAEKLAKKEANRPDRDALAIAVHPRSGNPVRWREQWGNQPDKILGGLAGNLMADRIPDKAAHDLKERARFYLTLEDKKKGTAPDWVAGAMRDDAMRVLRRKVAQDDAALTEMKIIVDGSVRKPSDLDRFASALLVARRLQKAAQQSGGNQ